jgi:dTDP-D-glucose 4,6-dehydratase
MTSSSKLLAEREASPLTRQRSKFSLLVVLKKKFIRLSGKGQSSTKVYIFHNDHCLAIVHILSPGENMVPIINCIAQKWETPTLLVTPTNFMMLWDIATQDVF